MYTTLTPDQVNLVIGYYLCHREGVDACIQRIDEEGEWLRREWEAQNPR